jgi:hypothetical protein
MSKSAFLPRRGRWPIGPEGDSVSRHEDRRCDEDRVPLRPSGTSPCGGGKLSSKIICDSPTPRCVHSVAITWGRWPAGPEGDRTRFFDQLSGPPCDAMAFTHRARRSPHTNATQTTDRPSRDQNRRFGPTGLILPSMEHIPWTPARARGQGQGARSEKSRHRHTTARSSRISVRLFFPYLKRYQPVTGIKIWASPSAGRSPSHIVLTLWPHEDVGGEGV